MIFEKGIFLRKKEEYDCEFILSPISNYNRTTYLNLRLLTRTILSIPLAFYFGYSIFYNSSYVTDIKQFTIMFTITYVLSFYILQIPHELIHYVIYSKFFNDDKAKIKLFNRKRFITTTYNGNMSIVRSLVGLFVPVLVISTILSSILLVKGFNFIIYGIMWANLIISAEDILNIFIYLIVNTTSKGIYELPNDYNYMILDECKKQDE